MIRKVEINWRRGQEEGVILVEVIYSRRRTMGLEVNADGRVCARVPQRIPGQSVMDFIRERQDWIVQKWFLTEERRRIREERPQPDYVQDPGLEAVYRKKARKQLEDRAAYYAGLMGVTYNRITGQLQRPGKPEFSLEADPYASGGVGLRGGPRAGPPQGDESFFQVLGRGGADHA